MDINNLLINQSEYIYIYMQINGYLGNLANKYDVLTQIGYAWNMHFMAVYTFDS